MASTPSRACSCLRLKLASALALASLSDFGSAPLLVGPAARLRTKDRMTLH
jgi:hypothetical protein